jgi:hypothetical protein
MGEARRRKSAETVHIVANGQQCFGFTMIRTEAISVQERFFLLIPAPCTLASTLLLPIWTC